MPETREYQYKDSSFSGEMRINISPGLITISHANGNGDASACLKATPPELELLHYIYLQHPIDLEGEEERALATDLRERNRVNGTPPTLEELLGIALQAVVVQEIGYRGVTSQWEKMNGTEKIPGSLF